MNIFSLSVSLCLSVFLWISSSCSLMHNIPLPHFSPLWLYKYRPFFILGFSLYKATSVEKRPLAFQGVCGATVVNCVLTVGLISCHQAWKSLLGRPQSSILYLKSHLVKELEPIIVSVKCWEIQPLSEHKSLTLKHVLTFVLPSKFLPAVFFSFSYMVFP